MAQQNNRSKLLRTPLEPGTKVFLKCEGLLGKLDARFSGPIVVVRRTANYNYVLNDILGNELKMSYPLHKLKIATNETTGSHNEDEYGEIKEVIDHESRDGCNWYLVKWVNGDENSWSPEENFNTMEVINKYFAKGTVNAKNS